MGQTLTIAAGFDRTWATTLRNAGVPTPYPDDATLDAAAWAGDDQATLFEPAVAWVDASAGTVRLSVSAAQSASVDPGVYKLRVGVTSGGVRSEAFDGFLEIEGGPGTGTPRKVYASRDDLLLRYDQAELLAALDSDQAGFREERADARDQMIRWRVDAYRPRGGFIRRRGSTWDPIYGFDRPDSSASPPTRDDLAAWLEDDRLVVDDELRKVASLLALAIILERQEARGNNPYRVEAERFRDMARECLGCYRWRLDTSGEADGVPDVEIGPGSVVVYLGEES